MHLFHGRSDGDFPAHHLLFLVKNQKEKHKHKTKKTDILYIYSRMFIELAAGTKGPPNRSVSMIFFLEKAQEVSHRVNYVVKAQLLR